MDTEAQNDAASTPVVMSARCEQWFDHFAAGLRRHGFSVVRWQALVAEAARSGSLFDAAMRLGAKSLIIWGQFESRTGAVDSNTPARLSYKSSNHRGHSYGPIALELSSRDVLRRMVAERVDRIGAWDRDLVVHELAVEVTVFDVSQAAPRWRLATRRAWVVGVDRHVRKFLFRGKKGHFRPVNPRLDEASTDSRGAGPRRLGGPGIAPDLDAKLFLRTREDVGHSGVPARVDVIRRNRTFAVAIADALARAARGES